MVLDMSSRSILDDVDPFIGTEPMDVPVPQGLASAWFFPKPMIGNTHPGATRPMGMVSACAYTGGYPTGYGRWGKCLQGLPPELHPEKTCIGFTHFQQSGVGAIRKYYNYARVVPGTKELGGLDAIDEPRRLIDEFARPGYYRCRLEGTGIQVELTVTSRGTVHRYTFSEACTALIMIDMSNGGIDIEDGQTVPQKAHLEINSTNAAEGEVVLEGVPLHTAVNLRYYEEEPRVSLWRGSTELAEADELSIQHIRPSNYEPFGVMFETPVTAGHQLELQMGFSWRSSRKARRHLPSRRFESERDTTSEHWEKRLSTIATEGGSSSQDKVFRTALYRSMIKPCEAHNESPFWPWDGPFYFDMCTMWDLYKTQLPLMMTLSPEFGRDFVNCLMDIFEAEGNFPIGYRMARGFDRFDHQASALAHVTIADAFTRDIDGIDWEHAMTLMTRDITRGAAGEIFFQKKLVHPLTHTLDLAYGCFCTARIAEKLGDQKLFSRMSEYAELWKSAFNRQTGLLENSTFYEGGKWNYSFRLFHDMPARIELSGGAEKFLSQLDAFFGFGSEAAPRVGCDPTSEEMERGYALNRFEGLCNEPDMEVPYAYCYVGRHDRTCDVIREGLKLFTPSPGGMVGNDDSGAMTSWYVWSSIGLFPVAGQDLFIVGSPVFTKTIMNLPGGAFTIRASETTDRNRYVVAASINGKPLHTPFLRWKDLQGSTLELEMADTPTGWGSKILRSLSGHAGPNVD